MSRVPRAPFTKTKSQAYLDRLPKKPRGDLQIAAGMKQGLEEKTKKFVENGGEIYKSFNPLPRNPMSSGWHRTGSQCACNAVLESTVTARCPNE
jgi:hypothetical protein